MKKRNIYLILMSLATTAAIILGTLWHVGKPVFLHSDHNFSFYFQGKTTRRQQKNWNPSPDFRSICRMMTFRLKQDQNIK